MTPLQLVRLGPLTSRTTGSADVGVALLDGPVAAHHPDLVDARIVEMEGAACATLDSGACGHGTFVAGILSARRGSGAPAICPGCTLLVRPIFRELGSGGSIPPATPDELAQALIESARAGARVVNLSAAIGYPTTQIERSLSQALDYVAAHGVLIVAAAGNQATLGSSAITRHTGVIPVVSYDQRGRPMPESNLGGSAGRRGLGAPGDSIVSLSTDGSLISRSGTSFAAAFVTGAAALLWSLFLEVDASRIRDALLQGRRRTSVIPPLMNAEAAHALLESDRRHIATRSVVPADSSSRFPNSPSQCVRVRVMADDLPGTERLADAATEFSDEAVGGGEVDRGAVHVIEPEAAAPQPVRPSQVSPEPSAGSPVPSPSFVYALGQIDWRFPTLGLEKEFAQATASPDSAGRTDHQVQSEALTRPELLYLVRQLCWVFVVGGLETYILTPRDPQDFNLLSASVRPKRDPDDIDAVIGVRGPIASPEMCNGLALPIVVFDQLYSFDRQTLVASIPLPEEEEAIDEPHFRSTAKDLFDKIIGLADNAGATDEYRALNYLAVRYPRIYTVTTVMHDNNFSFTGIEVRRSPLTSARAVLDVIFSYTHRTTDVIQKQFVRVDATEEWPFLVKKMGPYFES
jgi:hypothetical protein